MNRTYLFAVFVAALLVLSGCGGGEKPNDITDPFVGGNIGLNMYFQTGAPPPVIDSGGQNPFSVNVVVENNGEAPIGKDTINPFVIARLENVNPANYKIPAEKLRMPLLESIEGAKKQVDGNIIGGGLGSFDFAELNYQSSPLGMQKQTFRAVICYDYSNIATAQICMKKSSLENVQDSTLCTLTGEKPVANSGGPIHITKLVENPMTAGKSMVTFQIEHVGKGEFYDRSIPTEECDSDVRNGNKYKVQLKLTSDDKGSTIECSRLGGKDAGTVTLYGGLPQTVTCTIKNTNNAGLRVYTSMLKIESSYRYGQFIEQDVAIRPVQ